MVRCGSSKAFRVIGILIVIQFTLFAGYKWTALTNIKLTEELAIRQEQERTTDTPVTGPNTSRPKKLEVTHPRVKHKPVQKSPDVVLDPQQEEFINQLKQENEQLVTSVDAHCQAKKDAIVEKYLDYKRDKIIQEYVWMVFPSHDLFYCAVPKCGSTTWKTYLMEDEGLEWEGLDTHYAARELGAKSYIQKSGKDPIDWLSSFEYRHRLLIVRNPWARLASAYEDKIIRKKWFLSERFCKHSEKYPNGTRDATFAMFVDCILSRPPKTVNNNHIHPLTDLCAVCHTKYNLIVKLEDLAVNRQFLMKELNFNSMPVYVPPQLVKPSNLYAKYYEQLNEDLINRIKEEYRSDLDLFGYPDSPFE